jgi:hypothetical protein
MNGMKKQLVGLCVVLSALLCNGAASIDDALGVPIAGFGVNANKELGPACYHYDRWVSRIKAALDPNTASDPFFYADPEPEPDR